MNQTVDAHSSAGHGSRPAKWIVFAALAVVTIAGVAWAWDSLTLERLAAREAELRLWQQRQPWLIYAAAFLFYVAVTGLSLPGATPLTLVYAWYFGFWRAVVLVSFASTSGATIAFLVSRFLFRDWVERRFGDRRERFHAALQREGPWFLFTLRLIPAVPFFVINLVMGLTPIPLATFWWISQLGMLPGTCVYVFAGSRVPSLQVLAEDGLQAVFNSTQIAQIIVAFVAIGVFPLAVRYLVRGKRKKVSGTFLAI